MELPVSIKVEDLATRLAPGIERIRMTNSLGASIALTPGGARLIEASFPDRTGHFDDLVIGFADIESYFNNNAYAGATVGRFANRIKNGLLILEGIEYHLECNDGLNHEHGGNDGLDRQRWSYIINDEAGSVTFSHDSPDGHGGYPGELKASVTYTLGEDNTLDIEMTATSTATTVVNLVNHAYWNLAGHQSGHIFDQHITINAKTYLPVDNECLPTGEVRLVDGTAFDFRGHRAIGEHLNLTTAPTASSHDDETALTGYDHNWNLDGPRHELHLAAVATDPSSGRRMTLHTTEPGVQFYTASHFDNLLGKDGVVYSTGAGFALETQTFPCAPNIPYFPSALLRAGRVYRHSMKFSFDTFG